MGFTYPGLRIYGSMAYAALFLTTVAQAADLEEAGFQHGTLLSLRTLAKVEGPRWLDGSTRKNQLLLQFSQNPEAFPGTRWRVHDNQDGSFALACQAVFPGPRWLAVKDKELTMLASTDQEKGSRWRFFRDQNGDVILRNADGEGAWLNGDPAAGVASLSPEAGLKFSGAHWQVQVDRSFDPGKEGRWSPVMALPFAPAQSAVLPNGKILLWGTLSDRGQTALFDPDRTETTMIADAPDLYSAGAAYLEDGRLLFAGGGGANRASSGTHILNPSLMTWDSKSSGLLRYARRFPSLLTLGNGDVLALGGQAVAHARAEIWSSVSRSWRSLADLGSCLGSCAMLNPWAHAVEGNKVFLAGPGARTAWITTQDKGSVLPVAQTLKSSRGEQDGTSVQFAPGQILMAGGMPPTNAVERMNLNATRHAWSTEKGANYARRSPKATLLADGRILLSGGNGLATDQDASGIFPAEIWNPDDGTWTLADHIQVPRLRESTAVLLPDGRVFLSGGSSSTQVPHANAQIYAPPYFFKGPRPRVTHAPRELHFGQSATLQTPDAARIAKVHLIRLSIDAFGFNSSQQLIPLLFTASPEALSLQLPQANQSAPPGPYMLFLVDRNSVPSIASIVLLN